MAYNHKALLGVDAKTNKDMETLGIITDSYHEGHTHWLQIDGSYELAVKSVELVHDLTKPEQFARLTAF